jgi:hypothetical protein
MRRIVYGYFIENPDPPGNHKWEKLLNENGSENRVCFLYKPGVSPKKYTALIIPTHEHFDADQVNLFPVNARNLVIFLFRSFIIKS